MPTDPVNPDTRLSFDGGATFAPAVEEVGTGGGSGVGLITLTAVEMDHPAVSLAAASDTTLTTTAIILPRALPVLEAGTARAGVAAGITLDDRPGVRDFLGCIVRTTSPPGGGGADSQARVVVAYDAPTREATVEPDWEVAPAAGTGYEVLLTDMARNLGLTEGGGQDGPVAVDHDYGGVDALRYVTPDGVGIPGAAVVVYLTADYAAGRRGSVYVQARATTGADGRWTSPVALFAGAYTIVISKPGVTVAAVAGISVG